MVSIFEGQLQRTWNFIGDDGKKNVIILYHDTITGVRSALINFEEIPESLGISSVLMDPNGDNIFFRIGHRNGFITIKKSGWLGFSYQCNIENVDEPLKESTETLASHRDDVFRVSVGEYVFTPDDKHQSTGQPIVWYIVTTTRIEDGVSTAVHRRFRDFADLNSQIKQHLKGHHLRSSLPQLPAKVSKFAVDHMDSEFIKNRAFFLDIFLKSIVAVPHVPEMSCTKAFLGIFDRVKEKSLYFDQVRLGLTLAPAEMLYPGKYSGATSESSVAAISSSSTTPAATSTSATSTSTASTAAGSGGVNAQAPPINVQRVQPVLVASIQDTEACKGIFVGDSVSRINGVSVSDLNFNGMIMRIKYLPRPIIIHFVQSIAKGKQQQQAAAASTADASSSSSSPKNITIVPGSAAVTTATSAANKNASTDDMYAGAGAGAIDQSTSNSTVAAPAVAVAGGWGDGVSVPGTIVAARRTPATATAAASSATVTTQGETVAAIVPVRQQQEQQEEQQISRATTAPPSLPAPEPASFTATATATATAPPAAPSLVKTAATSAALGALVANGDPFDFSSLDRGFKKSVFEDEPPPPPPPLPAVVASPVNAPATAATAAAVVVTSVTPPLQQQQQQQPSSPSSAFIPNGDVDDFLTTSKQVVPIVPEVAVKPAIVPEEEGEVPPNEQIDIDSHRQDMDDFFGSLPSSSTTKATTDADADADHEEEKDEGQVLSFGEASAAAYGSTTASVSLAAAAAEGGEEGDGENGDTYEGVSYAEV